jgi:hypothetical protein
MVPEADKPVADGPRRAFALPSGRLAEATWQRRALAARLLLWLHVPALTVIAAATRKLDGHTSTELALLAALALLSSAAARTTTRRGTQASLTALGLLASSGVLVHLTDGLVEAHFHFFVMVGLLTLYQEWKPFAVAIGFVALHHGVVGTLAPETVYNHPSALAHPVPWAAVHALAIAGAAAAHLFAWGMHEQAEDAAAEAAQALALQRERQYAYALEMHDDLVQGLAVALYALEREDLASARLAVDHTLVSAKGLISRLLDVTQEARREQPAIVGITLAG